MWPARSELVSALAGQYALHSVLGVGGTSTVYRATDEKHDRDVAVKVLHLELAATLTRQRFARETAIAAKLQHPHILPLIDSGSVAGTYYYVMPLVEGVTLRERIGTEPPLTTGEVTRVLGDLADALAYAHDHGVVHRDVKPSNVLLAGRHALLMDFGVAKGQFTPADETPLTVGVAIGTPAYMAPEQAMASPDVDHRADLYALGVLGYELLAGHPPFSGGMPRDVLAAHVSQPPAPLETLRADVPEALVEVVMGCLEKDPETRWPDAGAILERLDALATPSGWTTPTPGLPPSVAGPIWRRPWVTVPAALILATAGALAVARPWADAAPEFRRAQLTHVGNAIESAISPDGEWLAYVTVEGQDQALYIRELRAPTALPLDRGPEIAGLVWASDGSEIAYHNGSIGDATIRAVTRLGGTGRTLGRGHGLPSPDLTRIAYVPVADSLVRVHHVATGEDTYIKRPAWGQWTYRVAWSADSRSLAIEVAGPNYADFAILVTRDGGPVVEVVRDSIRITTPSFSRDGRFLYYIRQETSELPDLMRIALASDGGPSGQPASVVPAFDGDPPSGFFESAFLNGLTHTADGAIVYARTEGESNLATFQVNDGAPLSPSFLTSGSALFSRVRMSPSQREVAFLRTTRAGRTVGVMPITGGTPQTLASTVIAGDLAWSPSGDRLALTRNGPGFGVQLSVHDFKSGALRAVDAGAIGTNLTWVGEDLVVQGSEHRTLLRLDPESGIARALVSDSSGFRFVPRASPDGRRIAFFVRDGPRSGIWAQDLGREGDPERVAPGELTPLRFDQTGESLYVTDNSFSGPGPRRVLELSLQTGELRPLATLPNGFVAEDITPDGRLVLATQIEWRGDIWRLSPTTPFIP